jgi:hypothetical protein
MKNLKRASLGLMAALFSLNASAQSQQSSTVTAKKPPTAAASETGGWEAYLLSLADFANKPTGGIHYSELHLGYSFSEKVSAGITGAYAGPLNPKPGQEADFSDPEMGFDFTIPLTDKSAINSFSLLAGASVVAPTSKDSIQHDMIAGWGLTGGLVFSRSKWTIKQVNAVHFYSYRLPAPETRTVYVGTDAWLDGLGDEAEVAPAAAATPSYTYVTTESKLQLIRSLPANFTWKADAWYITESSGYGNPDQTVKTTTSMSYGFIPQVKTFLGVLSTTSISKPNSPPLFDSKTMALRVGLHISI